MLDDQLITPCSLHHDRKGGDHQKQNNLTDNINTLILNLNQMSSCSVINL